MKNQEESSWITAGCVILLVILVAVGGYIGYKEFTTRLTSEVAEVPSNKEYIIDNAKLIKPVDKEGLESSIKEMDTKYGIHLLIFTTPTLGNSSLEEYANNLFNTKGIGDKETNKGLLLLYVQDTKRTRFEVGRGLEEFLPDGRVGRLLDSSFLPSIKDGQFSEGLKTLLPALDAVFIEAGITPKAKEIPVWLVWVVKIYVVWIMLLVVLSLLGVPGCPELLWFSLRLLPLLFSRAAGGGSSGGGGASRQS